MKKVLAIVLSVLMVCSVFAACSAGGKDDESSTNNNTTVSTTKVIETEKAVIKDNDAINYIRDSYSEKELGLADVDKDYSLMVASNGVDIDGKQYVKVAANVMSKSDVTSDDGETTYRFTAVGEYYISFDGQTVLMKDMKTGEYKELESRYDDYKSKGETVHTETEKETTKKK